MKESMIDRKDYDSLNEVLEEKSLDVGKMIARHSKQKKEEKFGKCTNYQGQKNAPYSMENAYLNNIKRKREKIIIKK